MAVVLLVEDEFELSFSLRRLLQRAGHTVLTAATADEAIQVAADPAAPIDLLLTDFDLEAVTGRELADVLRRGRPGLRVIYMSGYSKERLANRGSDDPDAPFLPKPFSSDHLLTLIHDLLRRPDHRRDAAG
jgi:DNA-binding NtrC family response regulator